MNARALTRHQSACSRALPDHVRVVCAAEELAERVRRIVPRVSAPAHEPVFSPLLPSELPHGLLAADDPLGGFDARFHSANPCALRALPACVHGSACG